MKRFFLDKAPEEWKEYCRIALHLEGTTTARERHKARDGKWTSWRETGGSKIVLEGNNALYQGNEVGIAPLGCAVNSKYSFRIRRRADSEWYLLESGPGWKGEGQPQPVGDGGATLAHEVRNWAMGKACQGLVICGTWFPNVVASPDFRVVQVASAAIGDDPLVQVEFQYEARQPDPEKPVRSGMILLDPQKYWLIREAKVRGEWVFGEQEGTITVRNEYSDDGTGFPVITRHVMHVTASSLGPDPRVDWEQLEEFDLRTSPSDDESRFTLSAFGLPQPAEEEDSGPRGCFGLCSPAPASFVWSWQ